MRISLLKRGGAGFDHRGNYGIERVKDKKTYRLTFSAGTGEVRGHARCRQHP